MKLFTEEIELTRDKDASKNQAIDNKLFDLVLNLNNLSNTESGIDKIKAQKEKKSKATSAAPIPAGSLRIGTLEGGRPPPPGGTLTAFTLSSEGNV